MENRAYLDFTAGIAVNSLGHAHPEFVNFLAQQARTLVHCSNLYHNAWSGELAKELIHKTRASGGMYNAARLFVCNSGTEANEGALKFARKVGKARDPSGEKHEIVSFYGSFHGRTMGALSATANPKYQAPFAPVIPGFRYGDLNDISSLETLITEKTCGVIVEPIQGEGGVREATPEFLQALRDRTKAVGAALIYDEIQCGLGRTGSFWAHSSLPQSAHPDMITTAKALGNGYPVGAVIASEDVARELVVGDHGTTFGGSPMACRIAHFCVEKLSDAQLQAEVAEKGKLFKKHFARLQQRFPDLITEVRGKGLMLGLQLTQNPVPVITAARERGLLIISAGTNTLRFVPPLVISAEEIEEGIQILEEAIASVVGDAGNAQGVQVGSQQEVPPVR
jgi:acetylornithine aminotransferase